MIDIEKLMLQWDRWREYIASGGGGSWPSDAFESILDMFDGRIKELEVALKKYGRHRPSCTYMPFGVQCFHTGVMLPANENCTCGFEEVING